MKKKTNTQELEEANNQLINTNTPQDIDMENQLQLQKKKDESEALRKLLLNLNEPRAKKTNHRK